jgi:citrate/tricarballylate utilization protein
MPLDELTRAAARDKTVCNACRYSEQYCPVFPALEQRLVFNAPDLNYLANLCHNCGECLYACQYAPPHEFGINVPQRLASIRLRSYEQYAWPAPLAAAFRHHGLTTALGLSLALIAVMLGATFATNGSMLLAPGTAGDFYAVMPHLAMVSLFGGVGLFVLAAFTVGAVRAWRDMDRAPVAGGTGGPIRLLQALRDIATLRHLHGGGADCVSDEEVRTPWRRWFHHATFYGFILCFASTTVAALYHLLGWEAPYSYTSVPVFLGAIGGAGLLIGPAGLLAQRRRRDPGLADAATRGLDESLIALLSLTSLTGLLLLLLRHQPIMGLLLIVHLGVVLALFITLPYGKFVHGIYRTVALLKYSAEKDATGDA